MPDPCLAGNGLQCAACGGSGLVLGDPGERPPPWSCPSCNGLGRVPISAEEIEAAQLAENAKGPR